MQEILLNKMKTGRPKLPSSQKKAQMIGVRVNQEERTLLNFAASQSQKKLSDWARETLLSQAASHTRATQPIKA